MFMTSIPEIKLYRLLACISLEINTIRHALQLTIRHLVTNGLTHRIERLFTLQLTVCCNLIYNPTKIDSISETNWFTTDAPIFLPTLN